MWGIRQFCFAIMILLLNTLFSNLSILIFGAFKLGIRYSAIFPDLNNLATYGNNLADSFAMAQEARAYDDKAVKKTLSIPAWLNTACENLGINYSKVLKDALIAKLQGHS